LADAGGGGRAQRVFQQGLKAQSGQRQSPAGGDGGEDPGQTDLSGDHSGGRRGPSHQRLQNLERRQVAGALAHREDPHGKRQPGEARQPEDFWRNCRR
jgi:hypothetical protein